MSSIRALVICIFYSMLASTFLTAAESLIFQERFVNTTGSNAPWSSVPGWKAYTNDATGLGDGLVGGVEDPQGSISGMLTGNISGSNGTEVTFDERDAGYIYLYRHENGAVNAFIVNDMVTIDRGEQQITRFRFAMRDRSTPQPSGQIAVKVGGKWYVHESVFESIITESSEFNFREFTWTEEDWKEVVFDLADMSLLALSEAPSGALPSGDLEGIGFWVNHPGGMISAVLDEYEIYAESDRSNVIADFGLADDYNWANRTDSTKKINKIVETDSTISVDIWEWAQLNWQLNEPLDLSAHETEPITLLGSMSLETATKFRIWIYDDLGNVGAIEYTASFEKGIRITQDQWGLSAWDDIGTKGTGEIDWTRISKVGFRVQSSGFASLIIDKMVLGAVAIPGTDPVNEDVPPPTKENYTFHQIDYLGGSTLLEQVNVIDNILVDDHRLNGSDWQSSTVSHGGTIFYAYIDPDQEISVMAQYSDGTELSQKVIFNVADNDHHVEPSLGIDEDGYLHLVGNMHNQGMNYFRSDNPLDVSSWTFFGDNLDTGGVEGRFVTYPYFFNAPDGTLFLSFRSAVNALWTNGRQAGAIARYNVATGKWTMLGNEAPKWTELDRVVGNVVVWDDSGAGSNGGYQGYKLRPAFSPSGRLHLSWNIAKNPDPNGTYPTSANHTHVMYMYSDDKGDSWTQADGTAVSPPFGSHNVEPVFVAETESLFNNSAIAFTSDNQGIVGQRDNAIEDMRWWKWNGTEWADFAKKSQSAPGLIVPGPDGSLTAFDSDKIHRSWDDGNTWKAYLTPIKINSFNNYADLNHFRNTGVLRLSSTTGGGGIQSIEFSATTAPADGDLAITGFNPPMAAYGRHYKALLRAGGGSGNYLFELVEGNLPEGLILDGNGLIEGVPLALGEFQFTVQVTDETQSIIISEKVLTVSEHRYLPFKDVIANNYSEEFFPEFAADGNISTRWSSGTKGDWIMLDLGMPYVFDQIALILAGSGSRTYNFELEVSIEGVEWATVFNGASQLNSATQAFDVHLSEEVQFVRLVNNGSSVDDIINLSEIGVLQLKEVPNTPWPNAKETEGWKDTWAGWLSDTFFPQVFSIEHGWLYTQVSADQGAWFYSFQNDLGWVYTNPVLYNKLGVKHLYHVELGWLYFYSGTSPRWFHRYETGEDFQLPLQ